METARTQRTQTNSEPASATSPTLPAPSSMRTSPIYATQPAIRLGSDTTGIPQTGLSSPASQLLSSSGLGEPLQPQIRNTLESSFNVDMRSVRVHTDTRSSAVTDSLSARAFTHGPNIFLGSGERPSDLALMAHEGAHVVQQQGTPVLQMSTGMPSTDTFELEAHQASLAVQRGERTIVTGRTDSPRIQLQEKGGGFFSKLGGLVSGGKDWLLGKAAEYARRIPGFDLLTVILGKDPITDKPVERNAVNLIRGLLGLVPGGAAMFDNLQQSGALQKAFDWFNQEITKLNLTWETIKGLFRQFWDSLSASDILHPSGVLDRIGQLFGPPLGRLINFALSAGQKILELIFEGVLSLAGSFGKQILGIIRKAGNVFSLILNDPIGFLKNLIQAVRGGFQKFSSNILTHLKNALFEWLFGALQGAGLQLPSKFDLRGILSIVLQVLGLTYARLREKLVKLIGEPAVAFIEKAFEFLKIIVTQGIAAAWQKILEFATGLVDTVVEGIRNWVAKSIVGAAITKLVTMFNPVGAIIQGIITIYNTVTFFIERAKQIAALAEAVFDSIINIATGNLGAAIDYVEKTMARTLLVIIGFLASLIGLGGISNEIKKIIQKIQAIVDNAITKVVNFIVDKAKALVGKVTGKAEKEAGHVQEKAQIKLTEQLKNEHTKPQIEGIVKQIHSELQPQGLKRLEVGPQNEDGSYAILAEASPLSPVMLMTLARTKASVKMAVTVNFTVPQTLPTARGFRATRVPDVSAATVAPGAALVYPGQHAPQTEQEKREGSVRAMSNVLQIAAWSTGYPDKDRDSNVSHAETQFMTWFTTDIASQPRSLGQLRHIEIRITESPCPFCAADICQFMNTLFSYIDENTNARVPSSLKALVKAGSLTVSLAYESSHIGKHPTTVEDIKYIEDCGITVTPLGEKVTRRRGDVASKFVRGDPVVGQWSRSAARRRR